MVVARIWSERVVSARCSIDDGDFCGPSPGAADEHWSGPLDGTRLSKGEHVLEVEREITEGGARGFRNASCSWSTRRADTPPCPRLGRWCSSTAFC